MRAARDYTADFAIPKQFAHLTGCGKCEFGRHMILPIRDAWARYPQALTLPELLLVMFRDGLYAHCDCEAGQVAARALELTASKLAAEESAMREAVAQAAQNRLRKLFEAASVPERFAGLTIDGYREIAGSDPGRQTAITAVESLRTTGELQTNRGPRYGILLYGRSDMGKTGLLCPVFVEQVRAGVSGLWVQYNDLLAALREFESGQVDERVSAAKHTELLFIDDFGDPAADRMATDYTRDVMFRIIDHRNNYQLPTFITSNLDPGKLQSQFHERIVKRLAELCAFVEMKGTPMRELIDAQHAVSKWDRYPAIPA